MSIQILTETGEKIVDLDLDKYPEIYSDICHNFMKDVKTFDEHNNEYLQRDIQISTERLAVSKQYVMGAISQAERGNFECNSEFETFVNWVNVLKTQQSIMKDIDKEEEQSIGQFMLAFRDNMGRLNSLKTDLPSLLRSMIDSRETSALIRLTQLFSQTERECQSRKSMLETILREVDKANVKYRSVLAENQRLEAENNKTQHDLITFTSSESFKMIQQSRRHKLISEEWKDKKVQLHQQIEDTQHELDQYAQKDKVMAQVNKELAQNDIELARLQERYNEEIRMLGEEDNISTQTHEIMLNQLQKELQLNRAASLAKEKEKTRKMLKHQKVVGDKKYMNFKKELSTNIHELQANLKKRREENQQPSKSNQKGKKGKQVEKKPEAPPVSPRNAEIAKNLRQMQLIGESHIAGVVTVRNSIEAEIEEMRACITRFHEHATVILAKKLHDIKLANDKIKDTLQANKERLNQRIAERNLELYSVNARVNTFEGVVGDFDVQLDQSQEDNKSLTEKSLEHLNTGIFAPIRDEIVAIQNFNDKGLFIVAKLTDMLNFKVNSETDVLPKIIEAAMSMSRSRSAPALAKHYSPSGAILEEDIHKLITRQSNLDENMINQEIADENGVILDENGEIVETKEVTKHSEINGTDSDIYEPEIDGIPTGNPDDTVHRNSRMSMAGDEYDDEYYYHQLGYNEGEVAKAKMLARRSYGRRKREPIIDERTEIFDFLAGKSMNAGSKSQRTMKRSSWKLATKKENVLFAVTALNQENDEEQDEAQQEEALVLQKIGSKIHFSKGEKLKSNVRFLVKVPTLEQIPIMKLKRKEKIQSIADTPLIRKTYTTPATTRAVSKRSSASSRNSHNSQKSNLNETLTDTSEASSIRRRRLKNMWKSYQYGGMNIPIPPPPYKRYEIKL